MTALLRVSVAAVLAAAGGCADKLKFEKSFAVPDGDQAVKILIPPPQSSDQMVKLTVAADQPVDVYVFLAKDAPDPEVMDAKKWQEKAVASKLEARQETLAAKIPAKSEWKVFVAPSAKTKKAQVTLKMTN